MACVAAFAFAAWLCAATPPMDDARIIGVYIAAQARAEQGEEYADARRVAEGDLNNDGRSDKAVLYTIEGQNGTNNYTQYLAVFLRSAEGKLEPVAHVAVGGKLYRAAELTGVRDGGIEFSIKDYGPHDAACCPSLKGTTRYVVAGRALQEQKPTSRTSPR